MTLSRAIYGRRVVIVAMMAALVIIFAASFIYRMENPNLFVQARQPATTMSMEDMAAMGAGSGPGTGPVKRPAGMTAGTMSKVRDYMDRVAKDPNDEEALKGLGNAFLMMQAWDRALESLEKAARLKPNDTEVLKGVGIAYFNKEDYAKATETYQSILKIDPNDTLALFNLGVIYKHYTNKPDQARTYFEKVLTLEKNDKDMIGLAQEELKK